MANDYKVQVEVCISINAKKVQQWTKGIYKKERSNS